MANDVVTALGALSAIRDSHGYRQLDPTARARLNKDLQKIESRLGGDPYAQAMDVLDIENRLRGSAGGRSGATPDNKAAPPPPPPPPPPLQQTQQIGERTSQALEAVNFPGFVAALVHGTFDAIVEASKQQIAAYAKLIADITQSLDAYTEQNVSPNETRDRLAEAHAADLMLVLPAPGQPGTPRLMPRPDRVGSSPTWLSKFNLGGQELTEELTEGPLLDAGRSRVGEEKLQTLATMVLMGINRVVVNEGDLRAKIQFHAAARDTQHAEVQQQGASIASRSSGDAAMQMLVSTIKANAQADASIKADLMGEVRISFRSETFPLERFADSAAIQLVNRHAHWRTEQTNPSAAMPPPAVSPPVAAPPPPDDNKGSEK